MDPADLADFHLRIDAAVKKIMKVVKINNDKPPPFYQENNMATECIHEQPQAIMKGKINKEDIPQLVLLLYELIMTDTKRTADLLTDKMKKMYSYVMMHYNLYPDDEVDKIAYKKLFDSSVKLLVYDPKLIKEVEYSSPRCCYCFFCSI
jgi:hypothetical protein